MVGTDQAVTRREHVLETESKRVQLVDPFGGIITEGNYTIKVDSVSSTVIYIGMAQIGTATSVSEWQIRKVTIDGTATSIEWANSTDAFTNEWDERASYTYA